jgi:hypothetical protein
MSEHVCCETVHNVQAHEAIGASICALGVYDLSVTEVLARLVFARELSLMRAPTSVRCTRQGVCIFEAVA